MCSPSRNGAQQVKSVTTPALLVVLPFCLFGPHTIFSGNEAEFSAASGPRSAAVVSGAGLVLALIAVGLVLPEHGFAVTSRCLSVSVL